MKRKFLIIFFALIQNNTAIIIDKYFNNTEIAGLSFSCLRIFNNSFFCRLSLNKNNVNKKLSINIGNFYLLLDFGYSYSLKFPMDIKVINYFSIDYLVSIYKPPSILISSQKNFINLNYAFGCKINLPNSFDYSKYNYNYEWYINVDAKNIIHDKHVMAHYETGYRVASKKYEKKINMENQFASVAVSKFPFLQMRHYSLSFFNRLHENNVHEFLKIYLAGMAARTLYYESINKPNYIHDLIFYSMQDLEAINIIILSKFHYDSDQRKFIKNNNVKSYYDQYCSFIKELYFDDLNFFINSEKLNPERLKNNKGLLKLFKEIKKDLRAYRDANPKGYEEEVNRLVKYDYLSDKKYRNPDTIFECPIFWS